MDLSMVGSFFRQGVLLFVLPVLFSFFACAPAFASVADDESFCDPYQQVDVQIVPVFDTPVVDSSLGLLSLQSLSHQGAAVVPHGEAFALGLISYTPLVRFRTQLAERPLYDGSFCIRVTGLRVEMGYRDVVIHVASEFQQDPCSFAHVLTHERKHASVNADLLREFVGKAQDRLSSFLRLTGTFRVSSKVEAERLIHEKLQNELDLLSQALFSENQRRQALVDSPEEYAKNRTACGGRVQEILRRAVRGR